MFTESWVQDGLESDNLDSRTGSTNNADLEQIA